MTLRVYLRPCSTPEFNGQKGTIDDYRYLSVHTCGEL